MSATMHTPGPWWVIDSGVRDKGGYICHTNPPQHYQDQDERFAQESAERVANKLLIAASPELLEALKAFMALDPTFSSCCDKGLAELVAEGNRMATAVQKARAAIAKAEGVTS